MVDDSIDDRCGHVVVAEHGSPPGELEVRGQDQAAFLIRIGDDLEEEPGAFGVDGQVSELVDDEQFVLSQQGQFLIETPGVSCSAQVGDQGRGGEEAGGDAVVAGVVG